MVSIVQHCFYLRLAILDSGHQQRVSEVNRTHINNNYVLAYRGFVPTIAAIILLQKFQQQLLFSVNFGEVEDIMVKLLSYACHGLRSSPGSC